MNQKQIIAELRRSAMEDNRPFDGCKWPAWWRTLEFSMPLSMEVMKRDDLRTFYLLVACALEDEQ